MSNVSRNKLQQNLAYVLKFSQKSLCSVAVLSSDRILPVSTRVLSPASCADRLQPVRRPARSHLHRPLSQLLLQVLHQTRQESVRTIE